MKEHKKKVEQNNFATRKRLLEYDREMGTHRGAVYQRRNHALLEKGVAVDSMHMLYDTITNIVEHEDSSLDIHYFNPIIATIFGVPNAFSESFFVGKKKSVVIEDIYTYLIKIYYERSAALQTMLWDYFKSYVKANSTHIVTVPFFDGKTYVQAIAYPDAFLASKGHAIIKHLTCVVMLHIIDQHWKSHLRAMDDLKQSVQNAVYERQDPIITFKFEAYHLFRKFMATVSQEIVSFLFHASSYLQLPPHKKNETVAIENRDLIK